MFLRLQPYRQKSVSLHHSLKLASPYYGPVQVTARVEIVAYRLNLPDLAKTHPIFHVSCLKEKLGHNITPLQSLPPIDKEGNVQLEPEAILERLNLGETHGEACESSFHRSID